MLALEVSNTAAMAYRAAALIASRRAVAVVRNLRFSPVQIHPEARNGWRLNTGPAGDFSCPSAR